MQDSKTISKVFHTLRDSSWIAHLFAFFGWVFYFIQAWIYAHIQTSFLDEGGYLYIGDLYARGVLRPFQDYGPMRLYAPLAYLIPGQIEAWFGANLKTGRYFSVFCGLMMVVALWITAQRLGGKWLGAAVVWGMALTPISIQIYSLAITQALVACLLALSLLFVLGEKRPLWQIVTGSLFTGIMVMTRQNLIPVIPLLAGYIYWQHGKKAGLWALVGCLSPILVIHIIYWPNILQIWATWLPASLTPFLNPFRPPLAGVTSEIGASFPGRLLAFLQGIRFHYFTTIGFIVSLFLWPRRNEWSSQSNRRAAYFLATLFLTLTLLHAWASFIITNPYCTFCFTPYLAFFDIIVFLLIIVSISSWRKQVSKKIQVAIVLFILVLSPGLGYASFEMFGTWLLNFKFPAITRGLDPHQWVPFITIWDILGNKFNADYWTSRLYVPIAIGLILGAILIVTALIIYKISFIRIGQIRKYSFGSWLLIACLGSGVVFSPIMGGTYRENGICHSNTFQSYEHIGNTLKSLIPPGSQVFWNVRTAVPLLYAPKINIYFPQIYANSNFLKSEDSDQLLKFGLWSEKLARQWWEEADYIVTETSWEQAYRPVSFDSTQFDIFQTVPQNPCNPLSYLLIFHKKP
jgi:hypothetical protein